MPWIFIGSFIVVSVIIILSIKGRVKYLNGLTHSDLLSWGMFGLTFASFCFAAFAYLDTNASGAKQLEAMNKAVESLETNKQFMKDISGILQKQFDLIHEEIADERKIRGRSAELSVTVKGYKEELFKTKTVSIPMSRADLAAFTLEIKNVGSIASQNTATATINVPAGVLIRVKDAPSYPSRPDQLNIGNFRVIPPNEKMELKLIINVPPHWKSFDLTIALLGANFSTVHKLFTIELTD